MNIIDNFQIRWSNLGEAISSFVEAKYVLLSFATAQMDKRKVSQNTARLIQSNLVYFL